MDYTELHDEIDTVDGADIDRVLAELRQRGGAHAILGQFLNEKFCDHWAEIDPECCG